MPAPTVDIVKTRSTEDLRVELEPAHNAIQSLVLLTKVEGLSGLNPWVTRTARTLTPEEKHRNDLVMIGVHFAVVPDRSWASFVDFVDDLERVDPEVLRDKVLHAYARMNPKIKGTTVRSKGPVKVDTAAILKDADTFIAFLLERFDEEHIDEAIEREAYTYLVDPPALQTLIVSHLRAMWSQHLETEWERARPLLQQAVASLQDIDLTSMTRMEAARYLTGQDLEESKWCDHLEDANSIVFVPNPHMGPYTSLLYGETQSWVMFGARVPEGARIQVPELTHHEILVRLDALADDSRLRILKLVAENDELRSQEIMERLEISQSAASRHLKQLSATGYLTHRRCEGAKCYRLNADRVKDTLKALSTHLLGV
jgi:DNA-binding transcriptional ArsR family regulator